MISLDEAKQAAMGGMPELDQADQAELAQELETIYAAVKKQKDPTAAKKTPTEANRPRTDDENVDPDKQAIANMGKFCGSVRPLKVKMAGILKNFSFIKKFEGEGSGSDAGSGGSGSNSANGATPSANSEYHQGGAMKGGSVSDLFNRTKKAKIVKSPAS